MRKGYDIPDAINCSNHQDFTQVPNEFLRNPEITGKAKAMLCLLLSNKDGWKSYAKTLGRFMREGPDAIATGITELEEFGYVLRLKVREKKSKKWVGVLWAYTDTPYHFNLNPQISKLKRQKLECVIPDDPQLKVPYPDFPVTGFPVTANPVLIITSNTNTKEEEDTASSSNKNRIKPKDFEKFWEAYPSRRRGSRGTTQTSWEKICRRPGAPSWQRIRQAILRQRKSERWKQDERYIPHATTWLNNQRWLDDPKSLTHVQEFDKKERKPSEADVKPKDNKWME